jgi:hypothetical protein
MELPAVMMFPRAMMMLERLIEIAHAHVSEILIEILLLAPVLLLLAPIAVAKSMTESAATEAAASKSSAASKAATAKAATSIEAGKVTLRHGFVTSIAHELTDLEETEASSRRDGSPERAELRRVAEFAVLAFRAKKKQAPDEANHRAPNCELLVVRTLIECGIEVQETREMRLGDRHGEILLTSFDTSWKRAQRLRE